MQEALKAFDAWAIVGLAGEFADSSRKRLLSICPVLHQCIRPLIGVCCAPSHHGYQRACDLISGQASNGPFRSSVFACAGKTDPPSHLILSQTSAGKGFVSRHGIKVSGNNVDEALVSLFDFVGERGGNRTRDLLILYIRRRKE